MQYILRINTVIGAKYTTMSFQLHYYRYDTILTVYGIKKHSYAIKATYWKLEYPIVLTWQHYSLIVEGYDSLEGVPIWGLV